MPQPEAVVSSPAVRAARPDSQPTKATINPALKADSVAQAPAPADSVAKKPARKVRFYVGAGGLYYVQDVSLQGSPDNAIAYRLTRLSDSYGFSVKAGWQIPLRPGLTLILEGQVAFLRQGGDYLWHPGPAGGFSYDNEPNALVLQANPGPTSTHRFERDMGMAGPSVGLGFAPVGSRWSFAGGIMGWYRFYAYGDEGSQALTPFALGAKVSAGYRLSGHLSMDLWASQLGAAAGAVPIPVKSSGTGILYGVGLVRFF